MWSHNEPERLRLVTNRRRGMARTTPLDPPHDPPLDHPHDPPHDSPGTDEQPLYRQIATLLLDELRAGSIPPGERLPGERHLARHFGVSRETIRQALEVLRRGGLVATDRRGSHATLPGRPVETADALTFPVGARPGDPGTVDLATVAWEAPP